MTPEELTTAVWQMVGQALEKDTRAAAKSLKRIGSTTTTSQMYGVCCCLGEVAAHALRKIYGPQTDGATWGLLPLGGTPLEAEPERAFALRFIVAYASGDRPTALALFEAAVRASDEQYVASVARLLGDAADLARTALDSMGGDR